MVAVPDEPMTWVLGAYGISKDLGFGMMHHPVRVRLFKYHHKSLLQYQNYDFMGTQHISYFRHLREFYVSIGTLQILPYEPLFIFCINGNI